MDAEPPYWVLISILFSSVPMSPPLARDLHRTAYDLYRRDEALGQVECGLARGEVENLRRDMMVGAIGGPAFEARLETERGAGKVRFLLTRPGIELMAQHAPGEAAN
jgi:hypothetical protein